MLLDCYGLATDLQVVSFQQGPPIQFQTKSACAKSNGFCFFFGRGGTNVLSFSPNVFPMYFPNSVGALKRMTNIVS